MPRNCQTEFEGETPKIRIQKSKPKQMNSTLRTPTEINQISKPYKAKSNLKNLKLNP